MTRSSLIPAVRGLHFAMVHVASLVLGGFFWLTVVMMAWRVVPPESGGNQAFFAAAVPYLAAVAVHFGTMWYIGQTLYVMQPRVIIAVLSGALLTYLLMALIPIEPLPAMSRFESSSGIKMTILYFLPGWTLVQWMRPLPPHDGWKEKIRVPITLACYASALSAFAVYLVSGDPRLAGAALLAVLAAAFLAVHRIYHGRVDADEPGNKPTRHA